ncbi:KAP family NTPase [Pseudoalteromonas sp. 20-92]|uniref:P-loop NTPase fold protein n=1 Tax=Pseudoalteromonas sp. 20-92 TaxID=2969394 RepID=UPI0027AE2CA4|nr:P-loop NTPase fold protein [Pseudoalteromonas sp. 20-92]MDQ2043921.1 KAP family NTPase [Pseudoalteromonas sp. 20-92]
MSQVKTLPITATRWLSLLLYAITAATITVFLSKAGFVQKAYSSWSAILAANPVLHYSGAFLAGIGIKLLLDKFYISHPKRDIGFSWRYPPVTMSLWLSVTIIGAILYFTSNQEELIAATSCFEYFIVLILGSSIITAYQQSNERISLNLVVCFSLIAVISTAFIYWHISQIGFSWPLFITVDIYIFSAIFLIIKYINECIKAKWNRNQITLERTKNLSSGDFKTLDQFKSWFKDDSTIKSTEELEPDLQVYAKRITERLQNGGDKYEKDLAQHIALCGPYGCGKSSIVESIVNDLAKNSEKESTWIHSDISTWGAASGNVAHVILSNIIDDISQYIDMCAFRTLPKHYTEALKSGGSMFQFASTLLAGPVDIEGSFQKLNDVLKTTNHKLLITLQDVDRGTGDENEKRLNDIAALLDRLKDKNLSHINFIVAMGNEKSLYIEVQSKLADHIETIVSEDSKKTLCKWAKLCTKEVFENDMLLTHSSISSSEQYFNQTPLTFRQTFYQPAIISNNFIVSIRVLKRVMRRVSKCWTKEKLLGEVDFGSLLLLTTLREAEPALFNAFVNSYTSLVNVKPLPVAKTEDGKQKTINETLSNLIADFINSEATHVYNALFKELLNLKEDITNKSGNGLKSDKNSGEQHLGVKLDTVDYLKRILLETVPENELRDQIVIDSIKSLSTQELAKNICSDYRWQEEFERFGRILFTDNKYQNRVEQIVFDVLEHIGKDKNGFLTDGLFEEYTKQTIDNNNLEKVLYKLVELESGEKLLERQLERLQRSFEGKIKIKDLNRNYVDIKDEVERKEAASHSNALFQGLNIVNFLNENAHKLSEQSLYVCLSFIAFSQLADGEFNFLNRLMKNLLEVVIKNKNTRTVEFLVRPVPYQHLTIKHLQEHFSDLSPGQRENILQILAELKDNQENKSDIDLAIKSLSFSEAL